MENLKDKAAPIVLTKDDSELYKNVNGLSLQNMFYIKNMYFPNCYMFASSARDVDYYFDTNKLLSDIMAKYGKLSCTVYTTYDFNTKEEQIGINVCLEKQNIYARLENDVSESYVLYGHDSFQYLPEFLEIIQNSYVPPKSEANNIWVVASTPNQGYCLNKFTVKNVPNFDITKQYNDDLQRQNDKIVEFISNKDKSGIVFLHGEKGTGKTTYIRHLINTSKDVKFVFIQPAIFPMFSEPSFTTFLASLHDSVIILEDCESVVKSRKSGGSQQNSVSTLLNMSDGLLSDGLGIKFICTFNDNLPSIDEALLRKGRLISKYEFKPLCREKTEKLLYELFPDEVFVVKESGMTLADIYNYKDESYINEKKKIIE